MQKEERADILSTTAHSVVEGELVDEGMAAAIRRMRARGMAKKAIAPSTTSGSAVAFPRSGTARRYSTASSATSLDTKART